MQYASWVTVPVLALLALASPRTAVGQDVEISLASGWVMPGGEDYKDTDGGLGTDAVVRFSVGERFTLGVGGHWSSHGVDFTDDPWSVVGIFAEPRFVAGTAESAVRPFIAGRLSWARQAITVGSEDRASNGFAGGVLAGLVMPLTDAVAVEAGVGAYLLSFGDLESDIRLIPDSESSGRALAFRLALNVTP
jgi:hypothetical protein